MQTLASRTSREREDGSFGVRAGERKIAVLKPANPHLPELLRDAVQIGAIVGAQSEAGQTHVIRLALEELAGVTDAEFGQVARVRFGDRCT
jgi:hypothetical protein